MKKFVVTDLCEQNIADAVIYDVSRLPKVLQDVATDALARIWNATVTPQ